MSIIILIILHGFSRFAASVVIIKNSNGSREFSYLI